MVQLELLIKIWYSDQPSINHNEKGKYQSMDNIKIGIKRSTLTEEIKRFFFFSDERYK